MKILTNTMYNNITHIHIHTHTYTHIHTYTHTKKKKNRQGRSVDGLTLKDKGEERAKRQRREMKRDTCIESEKDGHTDGRWTERERKE